MPYLNAVRLHFAGRFQANVSTVNNDPAHFHNRTFLPSYQQMQGPGPDDPANGWFNPQGDAAWRLLGCRVTSAWTKAGAVEPGDPVLNAIVADADDRAPAKLVDLDCEQQLVSEIWGLQVRIARSDGTTLMAGRFETAAFIDIWDRATVSSGGDADAGAIYQSVLTDLQWADVSDSTLLTTLKQAASDGVLSIKFNVDAFNMDFRSAEFMTGRIVGTIGPATRGEPRHLVIGRQFMAAAANGRGHFFVPEGGINFFPAVVDAEAACIYLDLGNALPTGAGGTISDQGDLTLSVADGSSPTARSNQIALGTLPAKGSEGYTAKDWYSRTAGIVGLPIDPKMLSRVQSSALTLSGASGVSISEWTSGVFVRADTFVYRLSPGDQADVPVYAMQWGRPLSGARLDFRRDSAQLQMQVSQGDPEVATPETALSFPGEATTDRDGRALLSLRASDPGRPRVFNGGDYGVDGQVYGIRPGVANTSDHDRLRDNPWNFVSVLVWSQFTGADPVTWPDLQPFFQQYANLYPVMNRFLNLADLESVIADASSLAMAFGLDVTDPNAMPVTRDLSPAKRQAILRWLKHPVGEPARAAQPAPAGAAAPALKRAAVVARGGKAAAAARRLVLQPGKETR